MLHIYTCMFVKAWPLLRADNVLMTPAIRSIAPTALIAAADIMVTIHVLGSFQVYSMPVRSST